MTKDIYYPAYVAALFDRCSTNYRNWSAVSSFGFVRRWRRECVALLPKNHAADTVAVDLMAGTGEVWPHLLKRFPTLGRITAIDISHQMHIDAVNRLHKHNAKRITHIEANALNTDTELPADYADMGLSTFGLKTFDADQQTILTQQIAHILKPGGHFSLIEASDPTGWSLRPVYRLYLDKILPLIERVFLRGANDFSMIGTYTRNFSDCSHMRDALENAGLEVTFKRHFFGCATSASGKKPIAYSADAA
ncbi:class I SAM-dependent methyltransferase [Loktanella sp. S4079]|uniref:class I SAM-dependent methyltransferase n=1 Tax=Loktanella sp. S4079 TaxID=579483 RepID=UPI0005F9BA5F|nr:class I SAM-dependent methyltransferase [Loktanella sp. S4079]KJZ19700.1 ubiquinone biosynthesis methyltransferase UbiE [Loktanella sp. S4079]